MCSKYRIRLLFHLFLHLSVSKVSEARWGGGHGGWGGGGFHSGYGQQQGHGYGSGICAGARQRQGIGPTYQHQQQPISPYSYYNDYGGNGYNNGYFQNPAPIAQAPIMQQQPMTMPIQNGNLDYRINLPTTYTLTTAAPAPAACSHPTVRDVTVFDQQCIFPRESEQKSCSTRGEALPIGTTSITSCKSPKYYSGTGDLILEVCKDGKWYSDGKTLTCKSNVIVPKPAVVAATQTPLRDHVVQYVQNPQVVGQPVNAPVNNVSNDPNIQYQQPYWTYNQPVQPQPQQNAIQTHEPAKAVQPYTPPQEWNYYNYTKTPESQSEYVPQYPPYVQPTSTTTTEPSTTTTTTEATTTTTTHRPYNLLETVDWRQSSSTNMSVQHPSTYREPTADIPYSQNQQNVGKCLPLAPKSGVILECLSKIAQSGGGSGYMLSISDCQEPQAFGTEATYKCQMYYESLTGMPTQYRKCRENGIWTGNDDDFGCKLECGKSNPAGRLPLITFGETTILGQWPWHAALFIRDRGDFTNACGATLISSRALLTAAHCVTLMLSSLARDLKDIRVDLGRYHRNKDDPYVQKFELEKVVLHPAYNPFIFESDIAIIILKDTAKIGFHVRPICFPRSQNVAFDEMHLSDGSYATVVGWGVDETGESPDELRSAKIQVIGYRDCIESFEEADTGALLAKSTTFCAGNRNGTNVCRGDSGSGAFFAVKTSSGRTHYYLQGLVSLGINISADDKKCDPEKVSIFTRVSPYSDWINRVLSDNDAM